MHLKRMGAWLLALSLLIGLLFVPHGSFIVYAQGPTPTPPPQNQNGGAPSALDSILQLALDTLRGQTTTGADQLFEQSKQSARGLIGNPDTDIFFLDFGDPNLPLNEFAALAARNLLLLTPLYVVGYVVLLVYGVWKEHPIPNPILYAVLVAAVMFFLAAFAVITQGVTQVGRAIALAFGGNGNALYPRAALLDTVLGVLVVIQQHAGLLAAPTLLAGIAETVVILIQLAYRGISLAVLRLIGVLLIPLSVLLEGANPRTAGKVLSGFFEAWLDIVGKIALLLVVLAIASADRFADLVWFVLPAGLLIVIVSWKFFGLFYVLIRGAVERMWTNIAPTAATEPAAPLPAAAEAARAKEIDEARRRTLEE